MIVRELIGEMPINLSKKEKIVLNVVREYLDRNRYFNMKKILPFINSRFKMSSININNDGIHAILKSLVKKKLIVEGSKLTRDDILKFQKKKILYNFIKKNPGIYFNKIVKELKMNPHVVMWHLDILAEFNYIKKAVFRKHEIYFDSSIEFEDVKTNFFNFKEQSKKIMDYLKQTSTGTTKSQLSIDLGMHPYTITKYLHSLQEFNIVIKENLSNKTLYFLNNE